MIKCLSIFFVVLGMSLNLQAGTSKKEEIVWRDEKGKVLKDDESRRTKNGFGGWVILTDNLLWLNEWKKPSGGYPRMNAVTKVKKNRPVELVTFFSNPKLDKDQKAHITYNLTITKPDGNVDIITTGGVCTVGKITDGLLATRVCENPLSFMAEPHDPAGDWKFEVTLTDKIGGTVLNLAYSFKLEK